MNMSDSMTDFPHLCWALPCIRVHRNLFLVDGVGLVAGAPSDRVKDSGYLHSWLSWTFAAAGYIQLSWMHYLACFTFLDAQFGLGYWLCASILDECNVHCASILDGLSGLGYEMRLSWMHSAARVTRCRSVKGGQKCNRVSLCAG